MIVMPEICCICDGEIPEGFAREIPGIGVMHDESTEECMTKSERQFHRDCAYLDEIKNEFSRKGYVKVEHFVWVVDKLTYEWELTPWHHHRPQK